MSRVKRPKSVYPMGDGTIMIDGIDLRSVDAKCGENVGSSVRHPFYGTIAEILPWQGWRNGGRGDCSGK